MKAQCCKTDKDHVQRIPENMDNIDKQPKILKEDIYVYISGLATRPTSIGISKRKLPLSCLGTRTSMDPLNNHI